MAKAPRSPNPEIRKLVRQLLRQRWEVTITGSGHLKALPPDGPAIFLPMTPSDNRSWKNVRAQLRRAGAEL